MTHLINYHGSTSQHQHHNTIPQHSSLLFSLPHVSILTLSLWITAVRVYRGASSHSADSNRQDNYLF